MKLYSADNADKLHQLFFEVLPPDKSYKARRLFEAGYAPIEFPLKKDADAFCKLAREQGISCRAILEYDEWRIVQNNV